MAMSISFHFSYFTLLTEPFIKNLISDYLIKLFEVTVPNSVLQTS